MHGCLLILFFTRLPASPKGGRDVIYKLSVSRMSHNIES